METTVFILSGMKVKNLEQVDLHTNIDALQNKYSVLKNVYFYFCKYFSDTDMHFCHVDIV